MRGINVASQGNRKYLEMVGWVVVFVLAWELLSNTVISPLFLPPPSTVANHLLTEFSIARLFETLAVLAIGFPVSVGIGFLLGFLISYFKSLYNSVYPVILSFKAIPSSAVAILLVVWIGTGFATKFVVVLYIGFFSVMVNTIGGLSRIKYDYVEMMQSIQASKISIFRKLLLPNALPNIFTGLKNAAGLGYLFTWAASINNVPMEFAALVWMGILGMVLFGVVVLVERLMHPWYLRKF